MRRDVRAMGLVLLVLGACADADAARPQTSDVTRVVTRGRLPERLLLTGEIDAADGVELSGPRTEDWNLSLRWLAEDGAQVAAGDRVVGFDTAPTLAKIRELELSVVEAANAIGEQQAKSQVSIAEKAFEVEKQEIAVAKAKLDASVPEALLSRREANNFALALARAEVALTTAVSDAQATRAGAALEAELKRIALDKAERGLAAAHKQLEGLDLKAPLAGIFLVGDHPWEGRKLHAGDNVWPGMTVARLPDLSKLVVRARLDDVDDGRVHPGQTVRCFVDAWPDVPLSGHVTTVGAVAQEVANQSTRRYFDVQVALDTEAPGTLRPGLSVRVEVETRVHDDALLVPRDAIRFDGRVDGGVDGRTASVQLVDGTPVALTIEACDAHRCAIAGGLDEGAALAPAQGSP